MQRSGDTDRSRSRQATVPRHQGSESAQTQATAAAAVDESGDSSLYRQPSPRPQSSSYQQPSAPRQPSLPPHQPSQPSQPQPGESTNMWAPRSVPSPAPAPRPNPPPPRSAPPSASAPKPNPPRPKPTPLPPTPPPPDPPLFKPSDYTDSEDDEEDDGYGDNENSTHLGTIRDNERGPTQQVGWDTGVRADDITAPAGQKRSRMLMELDDEGEKGDGEEKEDGEETGVIPTRQESSDEEEEEGVGPTQQIFPPVCTGFRVVGFLLTYSSPRLCSDAIYSIIPNLQKKDEFYAINTTANFKHHGFTLSIIRIWSLLIIVARGRKLPSRSSLLQNDNVIDNAFAPRTRHHLPPRHLPLKPIITSPHHSTTTAPANPSPAHQPNHVAPTLRRRLQVLDDKRGRPLPLPPQTLQHATRAPRARHLRQA